jgi:hypothetical protein
MSLNCGHQPAYCSSPTRYMSMETHGGMILMGKTEELGEKPVLLCLSQISHVLTRARTWASAERGRQLTAWAMDLHHPLMSPALHTIYISLLWLSSLQQTFCFLWLFGLRFHVWNFELDLCLCEWIPSVLFALFKLLHYMKVTELHCLRIFLNRGLLFSWNNSHAYSLISPFSMLSCNGQRCLLIWEK